MDPMHEFIVIYMYRCFFHLMILDFVMIIVPIMMHANFERGVPHLSWAWDFN